MSNDRNEMAVVFRSLYRAWTNSYSVRSGALRTQS